VAGSTASRQNRCDRRFLPQGRQPCGATPWSGTGVIPRSLHYGKSTSFSRHQDAGAHSTECIAFAGGTGLNEHDAQRMHSAPPCRKRDKDLYACLPASEEAGPNNAP
jgi:hypothetical protein